MRQRLTLQLRWILRPFLSTFAVTVPIAFAASVARVGGFAYWQRTLVASLALGACAGFGAKPIVDLGRRAAAGNMTAMLACTTNASDADVLAGVGLHQSLIARDLAAVAAAGK